MKVTGPNTGSPGPGEPGQPGPDVNDVAGADPARPAAAESNAAERTGATPAQASGAAFAERLAGTAAGAADPAAAARGATRISTTQIAADLDAGHLQPQAAIEKVLDLVLTRQLGEGAPAAVRDRVRAALRETLENDPLLAEQIRSLASSG